MGVRCSAPEREEDCISCVFVAFVAFVTFVCVRVSVATWLPSLLSANCE